MKIECMCERCKYQDVPMGAYPCGECKFSFPPNSDEFKAIASRFKLTDDAAELIDQEDNGERIMTMKEADEISENAVKTFGPLMQLVVCIEELAELQKELTKCIRNGDLARHTLAINPALAEEMADVEIMLMQLYYMAGNKKTVLKIATSKLERLAKRIEKTEE